MGESFPASESTQVFVEVYFSPNPGDNPDLLTPADITEWVRSIYIRRGRNRETDKMEAGTCAVLLDNRDGRFDPDNSAGPYSPNVKPMKWVRVRAQKTGTPTVPITAIFQGHIEAWTPVFPTENEATVEILASDAFRFLSISRSTVSVASQRSDLQISAVLDDVSWPAAKRAITQGKSTLQAFTLADEPASEAIHRINTSEVGLFFFDSASNATFQDRHWRIRNADTVRRTFSNDLNETSHLRVSSAKLSYDDSLLYNHTIVEARGLAPQSAEDATSQTSYLKRTLHISDTISTDVNESLDHARFLLARYKDPATRIEMIEFPMLSGIQMNAILDDIGDRVNIKLDTPGTGDTIDDDYHIEGIEHDITPEDWRMRIYLSPSTTQAYWLLESATNGVLGTSTKLAY